MRMTQAWHVHGTARHGTARASHARHTVSTTPGRASCCYRVTYRSMDRNLTDAEINLLQVRDPAEIVVLAARALARAARAKIPLDGMALHGLPMTAHDHRVLHLAPH